jgi:hypothetical protein
LGKIKQALRQKVVYKASSKEESYPRDTHVEHEPLHWPEVNQGHSEESLSFVTQSNILPSVQDPLAFKGDRKDEQLDPLDWHQERNNQDLSELAWTLFESDSTETAPSSSVSSKDNHEDDEELLDWLIEQDLVGDGNELIPASCLAYDPNVFED